MYYVCVELVIKSKQKLVSNSLTMLIINYCKILSRGLYLSYSFVKYVYNCMPLQNTYREVAYRTTNTVTLTSLW